MFRFHNGFGFWDKSGTVHLALPVEKAPLLKPRVTRRGWRNTNGLVTRRTANLVHRSVYLSFHFDGDYG